MSAGFFSWPGAPAERPGPPFVDGGDASVGDDDDESVDDEGWFITADDEALVADDDAALAALALAEFRPPFDPPASLIPLAALSNTLVVALLSAPTAKTTLATSKSKSIAYSGADTPASSLAICRNILPPKSYYAKWPRSSPRTGEGHVWLGRVKINTGS
jgi:hypothetical protein